MPPLCKHTTNHLVQRAVGRVKKRLGQEITRDLSPVREETAAFRLVMATVSSLTKGGKPRTVTVV